MAFYDFLKNNKANSSTVNENVKTGFKLNNIGLIARRNTEVLLEKVKGEVEQKLKLWKDIGEEHLENFDELEMIYGKVPLVHGAINKTVDFTIGTGFSIKTENEKVKEILEQFMKDVSFDLVIRNVIRDVLIYGCSFVELVKQAGGIVDVIPRSPKYMYVKRDKFGLVEGYTQYRGMLASVIRFSPNEMSFFTTNVLGDRAYGTSCITPLRKIVENKLSLENDMATLVRRKSNAPIHVKLGSETNLATSDDLETFRQSLEDMRSDQEWVTNHAVEMDVVGFEGKVMDLAPYNSHYENQLIYGLEIPYVLLGLANVPEGLASVQMEAFERKIVSIQQSIEKVVENDIFRKILESNGLQTDDLELEWNKTSESERRAEISSLNTTLSLASTGLLSLDFVSEVEKRLRELFNFPARELTRAEEENRPVPVIPGQQNVEQRSLAHVHEHVLVEELFDKNLQEWIGFNYREYLLNIKKFIESSRFEKREYKTFKYIPGTQQSEWEELTIKYHLQDNLSKKQVESLRNVLLNAFDEGKSVRKISKDIINKVRPGDLQVLIPETKNEVGDVLRKSYSRTVSELQRSLSMARTETIRASNEGALMNYANAEVQEVSWSASIGDRTCSYCDEQNGKIYGIEQARDLIPAHDMCRCSFSPVINT